MRYTFAVLMLLLTAGAAVADDSPRFLIEQIDVRNTRHASPAIIRAETRLSPGQSYTEADLREASYRVARLPFVLDAQYALEKGSRRDAYIFVITVTETKPLFFDAQLTAFLGRDNDVGTTELLGGGRLFVGSRGVFHAAAGSMQPIGRDTSGDIRTIQVGYTQYDLLGTRAFANIDLTKHFINNAGSTSPDVSLLVGVPIGGSNTLSLQATRAVGAYETRTLTGAPFRSTSTNKSAAVMWSYNTTNSPFFPTRGVLLSATAQRSRAEFRGLYFDPEGRSTSRNSLLQLSAAKFWELSERNSISTRFQGQLSDSRSESTGTFPPGYVGTSSNHSGYESLTVEFSHSLFDEARTRAAGDSRIDVLAGVSRTSSSYSFADFDRQHTAPVLGAWWARRTAWGLLRIGASYQW